MKKHMHFMEVGMAFILAIPVMGVAAGMYGFGMQAPQIAVLMGMIGVILFAIGHVGRQEAREKKNGNN